MKKRLIVAILLALILVVVVEVFLPNYYEEQVEKGLHSQVTGLEYLDVELSSRPAILLLLGRIQHGSLHAKGVTLEGIRLEEIRAEYKDLVIVKTPQGTRAASGTNTFFEAIFREDDLNRYIAARFAELQDARLELAPTGASLLMELNVFNTPLPLRANGNFSIPNDHTIRFTLQGLDVGQINLSTSLVSSLLKEMEFDLEMEQYPFPLDLREVRLEQDRLRVLGGTAQ